MEFLLALIVVFLHGIPGSNGLWTVSRLTAKAGGSVTIPCHYHKMFRNHDKYWCKGKGWSTCIVLGGTNTRQRRANMTVTDDPTELVMTATMSNLKTTETNRYWCAVKIGGFMKPDVRTSLELTVTDDLPDLSAANSMLSAQQGGNVSVQCLYHNKMKYKEKKWCRSGDLHSCRSLDDLEPPQHGSLQISDDENGTFTVTVGGLEREDMGWYWCMAGDVQYPVHITVTSNGSLGTIPTGPVLPPLSSTQPTAISSSTAAPNTSPAGSSPLPKPTTNPTKTQPPHKNATLSPTPRSTTTLSLSTHQLSSSTNKNSTLTHGTSKTVTQHPVFKSTLRMTVPLTSTSTQRTSHATVNRETRDGVQSWITALTVSFTLCLLMILIGVSWKWCRQKSDEQTREELDSIITIERNGRDSISLVGNEWRGSLGIRAGSDPFAEL